MSFQQALSGLSAAQVNLDTIGNNVANANTVGFKGGRAEFADVYANTLNGATGDQVGMGVTVNRVEQSFNQGNITNSSNPLDVAIKGNGFFRIDNNGVISYSRNGQFHIDKDGYLVNSSSQKVTGYGVANGAVQQGLATDLKITSLSAPPKATGNLALTLNLDGRTSTVVDPTQFDPTNPATYTNSTSATVYDSQGNAHSLTTYYALTAKADPNAVPPVNQTWNVFAVLDNQSPGMSLDGNAPTAADPATVPPTAAVFATSQLTFDTAGAMLSPATGTNIVLGYPTAATTTSTFTATPLSVQLSLAGTTQYGTNFAVNTLTQDGYTAGQLNDFNIGADGTINGNFSNGTSQPLGQIILANFTNPNGLTPIGNNAWGQSAASGQPLIGAPGSGSLGQLQGSATETSTVDLTAELVNMITAQRAYQANAQTIKTEDQILQTITSLR